MAELKTQKNEASVEEFLNAIPDETKRKDAFTVLELMRQATGAEARMWGNSIVGFGDLHYHYASGREGDWFVVGFAPRKQALTLYLAFGNLDLDPALKRLGKHKVGKGCLYLNGLKDVDMGVLKEMIERAVRRNEGG